MWISILYSQDCIWFDLYILCSDTAYGHKGCVNPSFCCTFLKLWKNGCLDIVDLNEMMFWVVHYHVLTCPKACSIQVYSPPLSSSPPFPVVSSFIRYILLTAMEKRLLHIHQTTVKQGGLRKRRSSRFIRAIVLHWFHKHIGPVSCVFLLFSYHSLIVIKSLNFWAKLTRKNLPVLSFLNRMYPFAPFWTLCHANNKKTNIH